MFPSLYAILDPTLIQAPLIEFARELADAGVELMQLRHKQASARQLYSESKELLNWTRSLDGRTVPDVSTENDRNSKRKDLCETPDTGGQGSWEPPTFYPDAGRAVGGARPSGRAKEPLLESGGFSPENFPSGARLIINDRPDIAAILNAGGVHVGQEDLPVELARAICPAPLWVGVSTHNLEQLGAAARTSADYIAVGPIFPTTTKENPDPVVGIDFLRLARQETRKPLVAIGGITIESAAEVFRAGADSIAVIRDLSGAQNPAERAREYLEAALRVRRS